MLTTATHDTKLGEDVRARINVLSEIPDEWSREVSRWMRLNRTHRTMVDHDPAPDRNDEYRFYQALVGMWTGESAQTVERLQAYMIKSVKEAKLHTSWLTPNAEYENAVLRFVERVLTGAGAVRFLPAFVPFQRRVAPIGMLNSLSQVAIKIGAPGVPDFYQGTDLWDFSLVDPDNRRPVDFDLRERMLGHIESVLALSGDERLGAIASILEKWPDGAIKLLITTVGLRLRRTLPNLFLDGRYVPLRTESTVKADVLAFARIHGEEAVLVAGPRLCAPLFGHEATLPLGGAAWKTSRVMLPEELAGRTFRHEITGTEIRPTVGGSQAWIFVGQLFEHVPVALVSAI
jgi:(1->4)-alpha-D-glucan 1-alpha-D-glucosylmutase